MNSKNAIVLILFLSGLLFSGVILFQRQRSTSMVQSDTLMEVEEPETTQETSMTGEPETPKTNMIESQTAMATGVFQPYTKTLLSEAASQRRVLFFYANWCPTCTLAEESFKKNQASIPSDVTIVRVNYNDTQTDADEKELAKKYGITYQHTFVQIDADGEVITKWNGGEIEELLQKLQ